MAAMNRMVYSRNNPDVGCCIGRYVRRPVTVAHSIEQMRSERNHFDAGHLHPENGTNDNGVLNSTSTTRPTTLQFTLRDNCEFTNGNTLSDLQTAPRRAVGTLFAAAHSSVML